MMSLDIEGLSSFTYGIQATHAKSYSFSYWDSLA